MGMYRSNHKHIVKYNIRTDHHNIGSVIDTYLYLKVILSNCDVILAKSLCIHREGVTQKYGIKDSSELFRAISN